MKVLVVVLFIWGMFAAEETSSASSVASSTTEVKVKYKILAHMLNIMKIFEPFTRFI